MNIDLKPYPQVISTVRPDLTGSTSNLQLYPQGSSASRVAMQAMHYQQILSTLGVEKRHIFTGQERDYAKYVWDIRVEQKCRVRRIINRYRQPGDRRSLETLLIVELLNEGVGRHVPKIDVITIEPTIRNDKMFPVELTRTFRCRKLKVGDVLEAGLVLAKPRSVIDDEYCVGMNVMAATVSHPMVIEDACVISQYLADKMMTYGYKTHRMSIGSKEYPLLLYVNARGQRTPFPDIGDMIRDDGLLFAKREYDDFLSAVEMSEYGLTHPDGHFDKCTYVHAGAEVVDVKVYRDDLNKPRKTDPVTGRAIPSDKMQTPAAVQEVLDEYASALSNYNREIRDEYKRCKSDADRNYRMKNLEYTPAATQAIMYAIADDPKDVNKKLNPVAKQFGNDSCDDYMVEITVKFPIPLSVSGKITDTMGGKGIVGTILPTEQMPIDANGNRVHLLMAENAVLRRTNFNRTMEIYLNAARRDAQKFVIDQHNKGNSAWAWEYMVKFCHAVNPDYAQAIMATHPDKRQQLELLDGLAEGKEDLRLWLPSNNKYTMDQMIRNVRDDFPPSKTKLTITTPLGDKEETVEAHTCGEIYMIRLNKWGGEFSAIGAPRVQAFGTIAKQHSADKNSRPIRETPIKHMGQSEARHQQNFIGGDVCADAHDRSNNPSVIDNIIENILLAPVVSNVDHAVDRERFPLGHTRPMVINAHIMSCDGVSFTTETE